MFYPVLIPVQDNNYMMQKSYSVVVACLPWWKPTLSLDLGTTQQEGNMVLYWKPSQLHRASEIMVLEETLQLPLY